MPRSSRSRSTPGGFGCPGPSPRGQEPRLTPAFRNGEFALSITRNDYFQIATSPPRAPTPGCAPRASNIPGPDAGLMPQYADRVDQLAAWTTSICSTSGSTASALVHRRPAVHRRRRTRCPRPAEWG
ncbi:hypothetical protein GXW82_13390 [Streptacidiphilus sp. 4-A2]|nr:hypothetical protein [Streptacidiphilus sp. 4-A2]